jgi:hypothetical protein
MLYLVDIVILKVVLNFLAHMDTGGTAGQLDRRMQSILALVTIGQMFGEETLKINTMVTQFVALKTNLMNE